MNSIDCYGPVALSQYFLGSTACESVLSSPSQTSIPPFFIYLGLFALTCCLEYPIYKFFLRGHPLVLRVLLINLATHPAVVFVFPLVASYLSATVATSLLAS